MLHNKIIVIFLCEKIMAKKKRNKRNDPPLFYIYSPSSLGFHYNTELCIQSRYGRDLDLLTKLKFISIEAGLNMNTIITKFLERLIRIFNALLGVLFITVASGVFLYQSYNLLHFKFLT